MKLRILPLEKGGNLTQEEMDQNLVNIIAEEWAYHRYGPAQKKVSSIMCKAHLGILSGLGRSNQKDRNIPDIKLLANLTATRVKKSQYSRWNCT